MSAYGLGGGGGGGEGGGGRSCSAVKPRSFVIFFDLEHIYTSCINRRRFSTIPRTSDAPALVSLFLSSELKEDLAHQQAVIAVNEQDVVYWREYRDGGSDDHVTVIALLEAELSDMQHGHSEMAGEATGYGLWATGYRLRATGYGLWATGYGLRATGYGLRATGYGLRATGYGLRATGYGLRATGYGLQATGYKI